MSAPTILVVEDNPITLKMMRFALAREGYDVREAQNGRNALRLARECLPDLVLQDYVLPDMDGLQLIAALRSLPGASEIPVLLITGIASQIGALRGRADANTRVLPKPIGPSRLIEIVKGLVDGASGAGASPRERLEASPETPTGTDRPSERQQAIQAAALSVIRGLSQALAQPDELPRILGDVLVHSLDAAGLSTGLLYLANQSGRLELQAQAGLPTPALAAAPSCFGHPELLQSTLDSGMPRSFGIGQARLEVGSRALLEGLAKRSVLIVPFVVGQERVGALVLAADSPDLSEPTWLDFARALSAQFGQAIALGRSLTRGAASEARYRSLMEQANDAILLFPPDLRILEANRRAEELLGCDRLRILGRSYPSFFAPEDQAGLAEDHAALFAEGAIRIQDRRLLRGDGAVVPVDVSASLIRIGDETVVLAILHDTSARKRAEEGQRLLEAQLVQAQKLEAVGRLAGGVAHDFNNLLGVITGYSELLRKSLGPGHPGLERLEQIQSAAARAAGLTRQLLAFSGRQPETRVFVLNEVVSEVENMLRRVIGEDILLVSKEGKGLGRIRADPGQIAQVLMNLVVNSRDAMPMGGGLVIETANVTLDEAYTCVHPEVEPGPFVMLSVRDTGEGMDERTKAQIFEPFFTTKAPGKGTGLGLPTVFGIVQASGGSIRVDSCLGRGATFEIFFPRVEEEEEPHLSPEPSKAAAPRGNETILLVEDADSLRAMMCEILEAAGYTVIESSDPEQALVKASALAAPIPLLLTDVVMPRISGPDLARSVRQARPGIKVLFMSGYEADGLDGVVEASPHFIQKPFAADALLRMVRETIDAP